MGVERRPYPLASMTDAQDPRVGLKAQLQEARAELKAHMGSWEYAFAMGGGRDGASDHPLHRRTRARTERLQQRCQALRAQLAEYEL